jgi:ribosomal protein S12 methylthiotransferase accessory factor
MTLADSSGKSLRRLEAAIDDIVNAEVGIVTRVTEMPREAGAPNFFQFFAQASNTGAFAFASNFATTGGAATDRKLARAKAIGEAVERYCAALCDLDALRLSAAADATFDCIAPAEFATYTALQCEASGFPFVTFLPSTVVRWAEARDLASRDVCWIPAAMVYVPYYYSAAEGELPIHQPISTGLACHCSFEEAAASALCEVIERDAVMITWLARIAPPQIILETLPESLRDIVRRFEQSKYNVTLFDISLDAEIPVVLATLRGSDGAPALVVAGAANICAEVAIQRALEELAHTASYCLKIAPQLDSRRIDGLAAVREQADHLDYWSQPMHRNDASFLFASKSRKSMSEFRRDRRLPPERELELLVTAVGRRGNRCLVVDLTSTDVTELGLSVVRAVIPGYHPLTVGHANRVLGGRRLYTIPKQLGYAGCENELDTNQYPHPYP